MNTHITHPSQGQRDGSSAEDAERQAQENFNIGNEKPSEQMHPRADKAKPPTSAPSSATKAKHSFGDSAEHTADAEPLTDELLEELLNSSNLKDFTDRHCAPTPSLSELLQELLVKHHLVRAEVVREAGINDTFGYQIFTGQRKASRNKVLQIVFAMRLDLRETNHVLQAAGANELHCKNRRDAIIIFCLAHGYTLQATDEELYRFGEETIC